MSDRGHLTTKQQQILTALAAKNPDGSLLDIDQLLDAIPYETSKQSMHFSIRALMSRDLMVKAGPELRRGRSRVLLDLGPRSRPLFEPGAKGPPESYITDIETDDAEQLVATLWSF